MQVHWAMDVYDIKCLFHAHYSLLLSNASLYNKKKNPCGINGKINFYAFSDILWCDRKSVVLIINIESHTNEQHT